MKDRIGATRMDFQRCGDVFGPVIRVGTAIQSADLPVGLAHPLDGRFDRRCDNNLSGFVEFLSRRGAAQRSGYSCRYKL